MASSETSSVDDGGGVVLSATALRHLEVEKAHLRFKLADAEKQSELRHGQVAAYESKIQDLLLLVEMNKKVAAEALKCSTTTAQKLDQANEQLERWQTRGMASLDRRRRRRHLSQVMAVLKCHTVRMRTWSRLLIRRRQSTLRLAYVRWMAAVPLRVSTSVPPVATPTQPPLLASQASMSPPQLVVHSLDALQHRLEKQALALAKPHASTLRRNVFSSWKGSLSTTRDHESVAQLWHKRQLRFLLRRVWALWTGYASTRASCRRAKRRRRLQLCWQRWVQFKWVVTRRRQLMIKVMDAQRRRLLAQGCVRWRLQSKNDQIHSWLACLDDAKAALVEERSACAQQKADVEAHLEQQTAAEQQRHRAIGNHIDLCLRFLRWGGYVRLQHRVHVLASQHASKRTTQLVRKLFFRWRSARHARKTARQFVQQLRAQHVRRYGRRVLFQWWRLCRRAKLLSRLAVKQGRAILASGMSKLIAGSVRRHKEQELHLQLKYSHVHSDLDLKLEQSRRQCQASQTASYMAYIFQRNYLRRVVTQWSRCLPRRRLLKRLLAHVVERWRRRQHVAWTTWTSHTVQKKWALIWGRSCAIRVHEKSLHRPFAAWRRAALNSGRIKRHRFYLQSAFALWRVSVGRRRTQVQAAGDIFRVLHLHQSRVGFGVWRRQVANQDKLAQFHRNRRHRALRRIYQTWRKFAWVQCHVSIAANDAGQARSLASRSRQLVQWTFQAWRLRLHHAHTQRAHAKRSLRRGLFGWQYSHVQAFGVWKHKVHRRHQAQVALARVLRRHKLGHKWLAAAWTQWRWTSRGTIVVHEFQRRLRVAHREVQLASVSRRIDTLKSTCWTKWCYRVAASRQAVHWSELMMARRQRHVVVSRFQSWRDYHALRRQQVAWLHQLARRRCARTLASALLRWRGHSHMLLELQYDEATVAANKTVAAILLSQQRAAWQREVLQTWCRYTTRSIHLRRWLHRRLCDVVQGQMRTAWKRWVVTPSPSRNSRGSQLLQLHWDRRRLSQSFREWHRLSRETRRRHEVLRRLVSKVQSKIARRGMVRWQLATASARQGAQRAKFAAYTGKQSDGLRQCLHLQWYWHRWYRYHLTLQDQRRQWAHRQDIAKYNLLRRCMTAWNIVRAVGRTHQRAIRAVLKAMRRQYLALAMSSWRRKAQFLTVHTATAKAGHDLKRANHAVAHLLFLRAKHALLGRCMVAWRNVTVPRRSRILHTWSSWMEVVANARHDRRIRSLHTLATRFHTWRATVVVRHHRRRVVRSLAARRYRRGILRGFHTWHRLVRRSLHEECLQRVVIIQDMVATQTSELATLHFLRPMVHRWRQAAVDARKNRMDVAECQLLMVKLSWSHWASYSRRLRRVHQMNAARQERVVRRIMAMWCRWQRRWTVKTRALRTCILWMLRRRLSASWTTWLKQDQRVVEVARSLRHTNERQGMQAKTVRFQRSAMRCASHAIHRSGATSVSHVWTVWTKLVRMRRWWRRKRRSRQLRSTWLAWVATVRAWTGDRLKGMWDRWRTATVRGVQDRVTRGRIVSRWMHDRRVWLGRLVWHHWRTLHRVHGEWRQRQLRLGQCSSQRALVRRCLVAWREVHATAVEDVTCTRSVLGLVLTSWSHAAKCHAARRVKAQSDHDQTAQLCRFLATHVSHVTPRLPAVFFAWKSAVFSASTSASHTHLRRKVVDARHQHTLFFQWIEYVRVHRRRRASSLALITAAKARSVRWKAWHAWSLFARGANKAKSAHHHHHLRYIWRAWAQGARTCHDRERWVEFARRVRSSGAKAVVFHSWRQLVAPVTTTLREDHHPSSPACLASRGAWQPILRRAAEIALTWRQRQVQHAWWRWLLHVKDLSADCVLTASSDATSAVAHWSLLQWDESVLHARRQQRWLMAFFTKACHVQRLRRRFLRWKVAAHRVAAPCLRSHPADDVQFRLRVATLRRCFELTGFSRWKSWYIQEALADAEREHALLMDALEDIESYRMSLDV